MINTIQLLPKQLRDKYRSNWHKFNLNFQTIYGKASRQFVRPPFPNLNDGAVNLHLGCGSVKHPKFINIDGLPAPHIHYLRPIDDLSPFKDNSADLIYSSHCLEHFPHAIVPKVLGEWFRVLKKNGILRLSVPDFDSLVDIYRETGYDINAILMMLMGGQDYKFNFHMTVFNKSSIQALLTRTGFKYVREWQPYSCELTKFDDCSTYKVLISGKDYPISLNVEAVK